MKRDVDNVNNVNSNEWNVTRVAWYEKNFITGSFFHFAAKTI